jgi:hypothetical protein
MADATRPKHLRASLHCGNYPRAASVGMAMKPYWLVAVIIAATACARAPVEDWRGGSDVCQVHGSTMRSEIVPNLAGFIDPALDYAAAKETQFPNAGIDYGPEFYGEKRGMIYVCDACVQARSEFRALKGSARPSG